MKANQVMEILQISRSTLKRYRGEQGSRRSGRHRFEKAGGMAEARESPSCRASRRLH